MSEQVVPTTAKVVVIGAGIVGNCLVGHLARLGWTDMVLLDKGPLPNPGGSTGHASNFIFPVDHNKEMALLGVQSANQYRDVERSVDSGGIEVARTQERMDEFDRRMTSAKAWGVDAELLTPAQVKELVPFINDDVILGGFHCPTVSVVDSLDTGTLFRNEAIDKTGLKVFANTEVLDVETEDEPGTGLQKVTAVVTDKGRIEAEYVVVACGVWSNRIANMAGATIPLVPAVHQMADVGPMDVLAETQSEISYPIVRDMDTFCYERQSSGSMEVGSYAHRPILHHPDDIPSNEEAALSPTEMPFTPDDFDQQMEEAIELMDMLGDAEIKYAINGLLSLTPDAMPCLGETTEVRNLWSAAAVWVKEGPGMAQVVAEWMTYGYPRVIDAHGADIARFYDHERNEDHIWSRAEEHFNKTYGIVHPAEQWENRRNLQVSPLFSRQEALDAFFFQAAFLGAPTVVRQQCRPLPSATASKSAKSSGTTAGGARSPSASTSTCVRTAALSTCQRFRSSSCPDPAPIEFADYLSVNKISAPGRSTYTPWLTPDGGFHSDLTMHRISEDIVNVVTGVFDGGRDLAWIKKYMPKDGSVTVTDRTLDTSTLGVWGPNAPAVVAKLTDADLSFDGSPYGSLRNVQLSCRRRRDRRDAVPHFVCRRLRLGDLRGVGRCPEAVGCADGSRSRPRHSRHRRRRVRHVGSHREGLPLAGRRARERVQPARSRPRPSQGEVGRLHRQGRLPRRPRGGRPRSADGDDDRRRPDRRAGPHPLDARR